MQFSKEEINSMKQATKLLIKAPKLRLMNALYLNGKPMSLTDLAEHLGDSLPLVFHHLNGDKETEGLIGLGLVHHKGKKYFLSALGRLIVRESRKVKEDGKG